MRKREIVSEEKTSLKGKRTKVQERAALELWNALRLPSVADLAARYADFPKRVFDHHYWLREQEEEEDDIPRPRKIQNHKRHVSHFEKIWL